MKRNNLFSDFFYKIEEEDLIILENEILKNEYTSIYESEYLDNQTHFAIYSNERVFEDELIERTKYSSLFSQSVIGICEHSSIGMGIVFERPRGKNVQSLIYDKELSFAEKIDLIYDFISIFDFSNSRGIYLTKNGLNLNDFTYDTQGNKLYLNRYPLFLNCGDKKEIIDNLKLEKLVNISPESLTNFNKCSWEMTDAWAMGLLIYEILEGRHLIFSEITTREKITEKLMRISNGEDINFILSNINSLSYNQYIKNILKKLLKVNYKQRSSAKFIKQIFNKKLFNEFYSTTNKGERTFNRDLCTSTAKYNTEILENESAYRINNEISLIETSQVHTLNISNTLKEEILEQEIDRIVCKDNLIIENPKININSILKANDEIEKIFENSNTRKMSKINLINVNNLVDITEEVSCDEKINVITPICGEINKEGENIIQFDSVKRIANKMENINSNGIESELKLEKENINLNDRDLVITNKSILDRLEEISNNYFLTGSDRCLEELKEIILESQKIQDVINSHEENISENLWQALVDIAYKLIESDDIKSHHFISLLILSTVDYVFDIKENPFKLAVAKFHYGKSVKDYSCNYSLSLNLLTESIKLLEKAKEENSKIGIQIKFFLGSLYDDMGRTEESISTLKEVLEKQIELYSENHTFTARTLNCLGIAEDNRGNLKAAREYYDRAYEIFKAISFGGESIDCAKVLNNLAGIYFKWEDYSTCVKFYLKVLQIYMNRYGDDNSYVAITYYNLGNCYLMVSDYTLSFKNLKKSLEIFMRELGSCHPQTAMCMKTLGDAYFSINDQKNAIEMYNQSVKILLEKFGDENDLYISTLSQIKKIKCMENSIVN